MTTKVQIAKHFNKQHWRKDRLHHLKVYLEVQINVF